MKKCLFYVFTGNRSAFQRARSSTAQQSEWQHVARGPQCDAEEGYPLRHGVGVQGRGPNGTGQPEHGDDVAQNETELKIQQQPAQLLPIGHAAQRRDGGPIGGGEGAGHRLATAAAAVQSILIRRMYYMEVSTPSIMLVTSSAQSLHAKSFTSN